MKSSLLIHVQNLEGKWILWTVRGRKQIFLLQKEKKPILLLLVVAHNGIVEQRGPETVWTNLKPIISGHLSPTTFSFSFLRSCVLPNPQPEPKLLRLCGTQWRLSNLTKSFISTILITFLVHQILNTSWHSEKMKLYTFSWSQHWTKQN